MTSPRHRAPFFLPPFCTPRSAGDRFTIARRAIPHAVAALALFLTLPAPAAITQQQLPPLVERALETMERSDQHHYAFRMVKTEDGSTEVATFDPAKTVGETWDLLQKNGKKPSGKEAESFRKERAKRDKERAEQKKKDKGGDQDLREMIAPDSLQLISETPERASYRFRMRIDDEDAKAMADAIRGTLVVSKAAPHVESLDLASTGEIKVMTGVKISEFHMTLRFLPPDAHGQALPSSIRAVVKGRALLLKKIDEDMTVSFSEYARSSAGVTAAR